MAETNEAPLGMDAALIGAGRADAGGILIPANRHRFLDFLSSIRTERALRFIAPITLLVYMSYKPVPQQTFGHLCVILYVIQAALLPPIMAMVLVVFFCALPAIVIALGACTLFWYIWVHVGAGQLTEIQGDSVILLISFFYFLLASNLRLGPMANLMTIAYYALVYAVEYAAIMTKYIMIHGVNVRIAPFSIRDFIPAWLVNLLPSAVFKIIDRIPINIDAPITPALLGDLLNYRGISRLIGAHFHVFGSAAKGIRARLPSGTYFIRFAWESEKQYGVLSALFVWAFISYAAFCVTLFIPPFRTGTILHQNAAAGCHSILAANVADWLRRLMQPDAVERVEEDDVAIVYSGGRLFPKSIPLRFSDQAARNKTSLRRGQRAATMLPAPRSKSIALHPPVAARGPGAADEVGAGSEGSQSERNSYAADSDESHISTDFNPYIGYDVTRQQDLDQAQHFAENANVSKVIDRYPSFHGRYNLLLQSVETMQGPLLLSVIECLGAQHLVSPNHNFLNNLPERIRVPSVLTEIGTWLYIIQLHHTLIPPIREESKERVAAEPLSTRRQSAPESMAASLAAESPPLQSVESPAPPASSRGSPELASDDREFLYAVNQSEVEKELVSQSKFIDVLTRQRDKHLKRLIPRMTRHSISSVPGFSMKTNSTLDIFINRSLLSIYHALRLNERNDNSKHAMNENYAERSIMRMLVRTSRDLAQNARGTYLLYSQGILPAVRDLLELQRDSFIQLRTNSWPRFAISIGSSVIGTPLLFYCLVNPWTQAYHRVRETWNMTGHEAVYRLSLGSSYYVKDQKVEALEFQTTSQTLRVSGGDLDHTITRPLDKRFSFLQSSSLWYALRAAIANLIIFGLGITLERWRTLNLTGGHRHTQISSFLDLERLMGTKYAGWACIGLNTTITETGPATTKRAILRLTGVVLGTLSAWALLSIRTKSVFLHASWISITCFIAVWLTTHPANPAVGFDPSWGYAAQVFTYQQMLLAALVAVQGWQPNEIVASRLFAQVIGIGLAVGISWGLKPTIPSVYIARQSARALAHLQEHLLITSQQIPTGQDASAAAQRHLKYADIALRNARRCLSDNELFVEFKWLNVTSVNYELVESLERLYRIHSTWSSRLDMGSQEARSSDSINDVLMCLHSLMTLALMKLAAREERVAFRPLRRLNAGANWPPILIRAGEQLRERILRRCAELSREGRAHAPGKRRDVWDNAMLISTIGPCELFELDRIVTLVN